MESTLDLFTEVLQILPDPENLSKMVTSEFTKSKNFSKNFNFCYVEKMSKFFESKISAEMYDVLVRFLAIFTFQIFQV